QPSCSAQDGCALFLKSRLITSCEPETQIVGRARAGCCPSQLASAFAVIEAAACDRQFRTQKLTSAFHRDSLTDRSTHIPRGGPAVQMRKRANANVSSLGGSNNKRAPPRRSPAR